MRDARALSGADVAQRGLFREIAVNEVLDFDLGEPLGAWPPKVAVVAGQAMVQVRPLLVKGLRGAKVYVGSSHLVGPSLSSLVGTAGSAEHVLGYGLPHDWRIR